MTRLLPACLAGLLAATAFEWLYKPAQQGRKVAYLTVASFVFLAIVMAMLVGSRHAQASSRLKVEGLKLVASTFNFQLLTFDLTGPISEDRS